MRSSLLTFVCRLLAHIETSIGSFKIASWSFAFWCRLFTHLECLQSVLSELHLGAFVQVPRINLITPLAVLYDDDELSLNELSPSGAALNESLMFMRAHSHEHQR